MPGMPEMLSTPWIMSGVALFLVKHLLADFVLQSNWIAAGKQRREGWLAPLSVHAGLHGAMTGLIFSALAPALAWLAVIDFAVHFSIDRAKTLVELHLKLDVSRSGFWWLLGLDQTLHHLTHLGFAVLLAASKSL